MESKPNYEFTKKQMAKSTFINYKYVFIEIHRCFNERTNKQTNKRSSNYYLCVFKCLLHVSLSTKKRNILRKNNEMKILLKKT